MLGRRRFAVNRDWRQARIVAAAIAGSILLLYVTARFRASSRGEVALGRVDEAGKQLSAGSFVSAAVDTAQSAVGTLTGRGSADAAAPRDTATTDGGGGLPTDSQGASNSSRSSSSSSSPTPQGQGGFGVGSGNPKPSYKTWADGLPDPDESQDRTRYAGKQCLESGYCSAGKLEPYVGEVDSTEGLRKAAAAAHYKRDIILLALGELVGFSKAVLHGMLRGAAGRCWLAHWPSCLPACLPSCPPGGCGSCEDRTL